MWNRPSIFIRIPFSSKVQIAQVPSFFLPIRNPVSPLIFDFSLSEIFLKSNYPSLFSSVSKFLFHFSTRNTQSSFYFYSIRDVNAFYLDQSSDDPKTLSSFFHPTFSPSIRNLCNESLESRRFSRPGENRETFFQTWPSFRSSLLIARNASLFGAPYTKFRPGWEQSFARFLDPARLVCSVLWINAQARRPYRRLLSSSHVSKRFRSFDRPEENYYPFVILVTS